MVDRRRASKDVPDPFCSRSSPPVRLDAGAVHCSVWLFRRQLAAGLIAERAPTVRIPAEFDTDFCESR